MKASEIRLGNYFNVPIKEQSPFRIDAFEYASDSFVKVAQKQIIDGTEVHPLTWYGNDLTPIPLNDEFLLKLGFLKSQSKWGWEYFLVRNEYEVYFIIEHWTETKDDSQWKDHWFIKYTIKPFNLQYIHQLQNLYFALTGEELTLKSE